MEWLKDYWWLILVILIGMVISAIKDLSKVDPTPYFNRPKNKKQSVDHSQKKPDDE